MPPLHERLRDVMLAFNTGLLSEAEYTEAKRLLLQDTCGGREGSTAPPTRAAVAGLDVADDERDVFPLPFTVKTGATSKADVAYQKFYNMHMWEVYRAHPHYNAKDRAGEVRKRWDLHAELDALRAETRAAVKWAKASNATHADAPLNRGSSTTAGGSTKAGTAAPLHRFDPQSLHSLVERCARAKQAYEDAHDQAVVKVMHMLPACLVGPPNVTFERKPHLFRMLRTAEVASVDSFWLNTLTAGISLAQYLFAKASWCYAVSVGMDKGVPVPPEPQPAPAPLPAASGAAPPQCLLVNAWKKFARAAGKEFKESDLRLVSHDTLQTLLVHFGKNLTQTERYWVGLQWREYQAGTTAGRAPSRAALAAAPGSKREVLSPAVPPVAPLPAQSCLKSPWRHSAGATAAPAPARAVSVVDGAVSAATDAAGVMEPPECEAQRQSLLTQLDAVRTMVESEEYKRHLTAPMRQDYEEALRQVLQENAALVAERNAKDEALVAELMRNVEEECTGRFAEERRGYEVDIKRLGLEVAQLKRELVAQSERHASGLAVQRAALEKAAQQEAARQVAGELKEAQALRRHYEEQLAVLRSKMSLCTEQTSRLSTELHSTFASHMVDELRENFKGEMQQTLQASTVDMQAEITRQAEVIASLHVQLDAQRRATESAAEAQELYRECLQEMREAVRLAQQQPGGAVGHIARQIDQMQMLHEITGGRAASLSPLAVHRSTMRSIPSPSVHPAYSPAVAPAAAPLSVTTAPALRVEENALLSPPLPGDDTADAGGGGDTAEAGPRVAAPARLQQAALHASMVMSPMRVVPKGGR